MQSVDFFFYYSSLDRTKNKTPKINETPCMTQFKSIKYVRLALENARSL